MIAQSFAFARHRYIYKLIAISLQTHWHSFFVLSDVGATMVLTSNEGNPLKEPPLLPTILPLRTHNDDVFRYIRVSIFV